RRAQIVLRRLLNEPGPEPHDLLRPQSELLPGCGPLLVRRDVEPVHVDPPTNPADSLPAKPELEQTPLVCVRERDDRVEAREAGLEEEIVQRTIRLVRRCGDRQRDVGEGEPERRHGRPEVLVSGVTERQDSRPDHEDPQVLPPPNDRYPDALFEIRFSPRTTSDGRRATRGRRKRRYPFARVPISWPA